MTSDKDSPDSPDSPDSAPEADPDSVPVDTEQLERAQEAIDEGHDAAAKAMEPPPGG